MTSLSLLMPARNSETYIASALRSVLSQMRDEDEIIVQDCLSTDSTINIVREIAQNDPRVSITSEDDSGQSDALNKALARATGTYVGWLNSDDIVAAGFFSNFYNAIERIDNSSIIIGGHQTCTADGTVLRTYRAQKLNKRRLLILGCYVFSGSLFIRRTTLEEMGGFNTDLHFGMDLDLMLRLPKDADSQTLVHHTAGVLRLHPGSKTGSGPLRFVGEASRIRLAYSQTVIDYWLSALGGCLQLASIATTNVRKSKAYIFARELTVRPNK
ncbi:glycosyltransferase [Rhodococcus sp. IEGM 1370]|uniref:glycosyltransferase n=1 Tax=Rhodococcus sp. IEGM 1370 TaxID=3082222 RepID=UPI002954C7A4|nr:glycosyltransferase [Rhodococcus sp. IEGM 1370]MDV8077554.1 glycosyltransferase [Rhodococcus sp. IEGM 1370]